MNLSARDKPLIRRNGRPQACDPCRVRKVACDHAQPVCGRCRKRNQEGECIYIIDGGNANANDKRPRGGHSAPPVRPARRQTGDSPGGLQSPPSNLPTPVADVASQRKDPGPTPGFLGFTSHSAVYSETRDRLSFLSGFQAAPYLNSGDSHESAPWDPSQILASPTREMWLVVLRSIPPLSACRIRSRDSIYLCGGWLRFTTARVLASIEKLVGPRLDGTPSDSQLQEMAQLLSRNSARPMSEESVDANSWMDEFCDDNIRWETVGIFFFLCEAPEGSDGDGWRETSWMCLNLCIDLCQRLSAGNSLVLMLCVRRTIVESRRSGDASLTCWKSHAETVSLLTYLGLHAETAEGPSYCPTLWSEHRRWLYVTIFTMDKVLIQFTGRPPLLGHRYVSTPLPLDVSDEHLFAEGAALLSAVQDLDERGWNTSGKFHLATSTRARMIIALLRDELTEIALGKLTFNPVDIILNIKQRQLQAKADFPPALKFQDVRDILEEDTTTRVFSRILVELEHLQNLFMVERLLLQHHQPDHGELLDVSFRMVSLTLILWTHKDRFAETRLDFEWLLMAHAAPGGGILCMELLDPKFTPNHPKNPELTRASVIQKLSLLVGFLDWVQPSAPNADMCASCKVVIQHVLDHSLNATADTSWQYSNLGNVPLDFNFDLLDTFSWARGEA